MTPTLTSGFGQWTGSWANLQFLFQAKRQGSQHKWGNGLNCVSRLPPLYPTLPLHQNLLPVLQTLIETSGAWNSFLIYQNEIRINNWKEMRKVFTERSRDFSPDACGCITMRNSEYLDLSCSNQKDSGAVLFSHPRFFCSSSSLLPVCTWRGSGLTTTVCVELCASAFVCGKSRRRAHHGQSDVKCPV